MKFLLAILLVVLGHACAVEERSLWDSVPVAANSSQCVYSSERSVLSCRGPIGVIDCPTVSNFSSLLSLIPSVRVFGLSRIPELVDAKPEMTRYWIYPRRLDNSTYFNHTLRVGDISGDLFLYYSDTFEQFGFRVTDLKCYERLVELFRQSTVTHPVRIEDGVEEVSLFGEVLVFDKVVQKKWLFGLGLGLRLGLLGWGWGGLGWGLPIVPAGFLLG